MAIVSDQGDSGGGNYRPDPVAPVEPEQGDTRQVTLADGSVVTQEYDYRSNGWTTISGPYRGSTGGGGAGAPDHFFDINPLDQAKFDWQKGQDTATQDWRKGTLALDQQVADNNNAIANARLKMDQLQNDRDWALANGNLDLAKQKQADYNHWEGVKAGLTERGQTLDYEVGMANVAAARESAQLQFQVGMANAANDSERNRITEQHNKVMAAITWEETKISSQRMKNDYEIGMANATNDAERNVIQDKWNQQQALIAKMQDETTRILGGKKAQTEQFNAETDRAARMGDLTLRNNEFIAKLASSPRDLPALYMMQRGMAPDWDALAAGGQPAQGSALVPGDPLKTYVPITKETSGFDIPAANLEIVAGSNAGGAAGNQYIKPYEGSVLTGGIPGAAAGGTYAGPAIVGDDPMGRDRSREEVVTPVLDTFGRPAVNVQPVNPDGIALQKKKMLDSQAWTGQPAPSSGFSPVRDTRYIQPEPPPPSYVAYPGGSRDFDESGRVTIGGWPAGSLPTYKQAPDGGWVVDRPGYSFGGPLDRPTGPISMPMDPRNNPISQTFGPVDQPGPARMQMPSESFPISIAGPAPVMMPNDPRNNPISIEAPTPDRTGPNWGEGRIPSDMRYQPMPFEGNTRYQRGERIQPMPFDRDGEARKRALMEAEMWRGERDRSWRGRGGMRWAENPGWMPNEWGLAQPAVRPPQPGQEFQQRIYSPDRLPRFAGGTSQTWEEYMNQYRNLGFGNQWVPSTDNAYLNGMDLPTRLKMLKDLGMPINPATAGAATGQNFGALNMGAAATQGREVGLLPSLQTMSNAGKGELEGLRGYYEGVGGMPWGDIVDWLGKTSQHVQTAARSSGAV